MRATGAGNPFASCKGYGGRIVNTSIASWGRGVRSLLLPLHHGGWLINPCVRLDWPASGLYPLRASSYISLLCLLGASQNSAVIGAAYAVCLTYGCRARRISVGVDNGHDSSTPARARYIYPRLRGMPRQRPGSVTATATAEATATATRRQWHSGAQRPG
jgi:hypothetical protein